MALSLAIVDNLLTEGVVLVDDNCQLIGSQPIGTDDPDRRLWLGETYWRVFFGIYRLTQG